MRDYDGDDCHHWSSGPRPGPLYERRVDPGTSRGMNIDPPSKLAVKLPKAAPQTKYPATKR